MAKEEENLKGYFKQFKKPVENDPTKISNPLDIQKGLNLQQWIVL